MRDDEAVTMVLRELFDQGRLPRTSALTHSNDDFFEDVGALTGHKQLLHQVNDFIIVQPRGLTLADGALRGRLVAWVDGSRSCLEKLQREDPERDWLISELAELCGLTVFGASLAVLYRSTFLQGCRNVGSWNSESGFPERCLLAQSIRRPRESLADLVRQRTVLPGGIAAEAATREAQNMNNAVGVLNKLEALLSAAVRSPQTVSPQALSGLLADLPDHPSPRPSLDDLRAASRDSTLSEYRRRLLRRLRSASRFDIELLIEAVDATLDDIQELTGIRPSYDGPVTNLKGPAWDRLRWLVQQLASALGSWTYFDPSLGRHLHFAQSVDYLSIVSSDWPVSRTRIRALDYEVIEPQSHPAQSVASTVPIEPVLRPAPHSEGARTVKKKASHDPDSVHHDVLVTLRAWARKAKVEGNIGAAYVFGSFVAGNGAEFDPSKSDLDLLVTFPDTASSALARTRHVQNIAAVTSELEMQLMQILKSSDASEPLVSVNVVTPDELAFRIHKGGERSIYDGPFLDLLSDNAAATALPAGRELDHEANRSVIAAPRGAQAYRNRFVRSSPNGTRAVSPWDGEDPAPKDLARAASRLQHHLNGKAHDDEYSNNAGYLFLEMLVASRKGLDPAFATLGHRLATRRAGRGIPQPMPPEDELLLWETLCDETVEPLRQASTGKPATWVKLSVPSAGSLAPSDQSFWKATIDMIVERLRLRQWSWFVDSAVRDLLHEDLFVAADELAAFSLAAVWPTHPESLVAATKALLSSFQMWIDLYKRNVELKPSGQHYGPDNSYRRGSFNPRFDQFVEYEAKWSDRCYWLLCQYIVRLNEFCHEVRQSLDPSFFRIFGNFLLVDSLGVRSDGIASAYLPTPADVEQGLAKTPEPTPVPPPKSADERPRPWPVRPSPPRSTAEQKVSKKAKATRAKKPAGNASTKRPSKKNASAKSQSGKPTDRKRKKPPPGRTRR